MWTYHRHLIRMQGEVEADPSASVISLRPPRCVRWWRWDRVRDRSLASFCWTFFKTVFRGGRKRWENIAFQLGVFLVVLKAVFPNLYMTAAGSWPVWPELVDRVPFWVVCGFIACRIVLAPLWIYQDATDAAKKQHDDDEDALESQRVEYERRILAASGYIPKLSVDKQPLIRLELRHCAHSREHTYAVVINDGDLAAINVSGECVLSHGAYAISFGTVSVGASSEPTLIPIRLFSGGKQLQTSNSGPPECEFPSSIFLSLLGAAQGELTGGDGPPFFGPVRPEPLACKFNITYTDPGKRERYNRTHVLKYSRGTAQIALDDAPDP